MDWTLFVQQVWNGLVIGMGYTLFAVGMTLIFGVLRVINLAHGEFYMLGAMLVYVAVMHFGINFFAALVISIATVGAAGFVVNRLTVQPLLRMNPLTVFLSTLGASLVMANGAYIIFGSVPRAVKTPFPGVLELGGVLFAEKSIMLFALGTVGIIVLFAFINKSRMGRAVRAAAQNRVGASLVGVNINFTYAVTFTLAACMAALAGGLIAPLWQAQPGMGQVMLLKGFAVVVLAGMGNVPACVVVGLGLGVAEALFAQYVSVYLRDVFAYGAMIVGLLLKPEGLFSRRGDK